MKKHILFAAVLLCGWLTGCRGSAQNPHVYVSPAVQAADGSALTLSVSAVYPLSADIAGSSGAKAVCAAAHTEYSPEALNQIRFGENIFGAGLASVVYFGKYAANLTDAEWSTLADIAAAPEKYASALTGGSIAGISPQAQYASRMPDAAYLDAMTEQIVTDLMHTKSVTREDAFAMLYADGVTVETPFSPAMQSAVDAVYTDDASFSENGGAFPQSACAVMDYAGNVLAIAAGNHGNTAYNRAFRTLHSIGSAVKPLSVYAPALQSRMIMFSSIVEDEPLTNAGTPNAFPQNYNGVYDGKITLTYALRQSKNTIPVRLMNALGGSTCLAFLRDGCGFTTLTDQDNNPSALAYGSFQNGVSVTELAAAYQMFGNGGMYYTPRFYTRVTDKAGNVLTERKDAGKQVLDAADAWIMNRLLYYNVSKDDGIALAARLDDGSEVCGKTGTAGNGSGSDTDRLFVGMTPEYCAAVWIGYDAKNAAIDRLEYKLPGAVWKQIMEKADRKQTAFTPEESVTAAAFCTETGLLAGGNCPQTEIGYYRTDNLPQKCTHEQKLH